MARLGWAMACVLTVAGAAAGQTRAPGPEPARIQALRAWLAAVERHEPGTIDAPVGEVRTWDRSVLRLVWIDVGAIVSLVRSPEVSIFFVPPEPVPYLPPGRRPVSDWPPRVPKATQIFYSGAELDGLRAVVNRISEGADLRRQPDLRARANRRINAILKRGATLHADIAMLAPSGGQAPGPSRDGRLGRVTLYTNDGRQAGLDEGAGHWEMGRRLLDRVQPELSRQAAGEPRDPFIRLWYLAAGAYMQAIAQLDPWHAERSVQLFPRDPETLFFAACLHDALSGPKIQSAMALASLPRDVVLDVGSEGAELREAERLYRRALEQDETHVEARIRLARVLGRRGRHDEAARHLTQSIASTREPLLLYYASMFLGSEAEELRRFDEAREAYARAVALYPSAQSPRLAASALAARAGDRAAALRAIEAVSSRHAVNPDDDPWWLYFSSQARDVDRLVNEMYRQVSAPD